MRKKIPSERQAWRQRAIVAPYIYVLTHTRACTHHRRSFLSENLAKGRTQTNKCLLFAHKFHFQELYFRNNQQQWM